jgi:nucleotide-binding universal stress UspA family protein
MYRHILIPTDGYALSAEAVTHGVELAREMGAEVTILTVTEPFHVFSFGVDQLEDTPAEYRRHMEQRAARTLEEASKAAAAAGVTHEKIHVEEDEPYRAIIRVAEGRGCDLIVMASHGRRGVSALVLGSETVKVLTHSTIPVLVYRLPAGKAEAAQGAAERQRERGPVSEPA